MMTPTCFLRLGECPSMTHFHAAYFVIMFFSLFVSEVLQGSYGPKCDMWSMGVIAYMMVSGAPPFWGNGDAQVGLAATVRRLCTFTSRFLG